ncbi:MAG: SUMF1/EgtB/PvdO family nonheme iron enzyme [Burkholderiaceae bacterium]|nr:SUMF1/EgtB/PvdO family nonheme iron enzyme [Burkholderiaceae bacterium]
MHDASLAAHAALLARHGGRDALSQALRASRADTLAMFAVYEKALADLRVPLRAELNPPLWELGHVGWFRAYWVQRNPQREHGLRADPEAPRGPAEPANSDELYHSGRVPHDSRWQLLLPDARATRAHLQRQLDTTLALLADAPEHDDALYFFRLALLHEDMHHEAALYMAQGLGIAIDDSRWQARALPPPPASLALPVGRWRLGSPEEHGFAFDNESPPVEVAVRACEIDAQAVRWAEYLPFVEAGGYAQPRWWSAPGRQWLAQSGARAPHYLQRDGGHWQQWRHGRWQALAPAEAACHLTHHEARAWCRWAGRRLPGEAEWERAAATLAPHFRWGDVWEWTSSAFAPFPGFVAHPYREYSAPWFDGRPVLRGASFMTQPRMRHTRYRNFFQPARNDVPAGFRSCAA